MSRNGADLACRWLCQLGIDDKVPNNSTFSVNRLGRFHESEILVIFTSAVVSGLVKGEGVSSECERDEDQCQPL